MGKLCHDFDNQVQERFKHKASAFGGRIRSFQHRAIFPLSARLILAGIRLFLRLFRQALNLLGGHNNHSCGSYVNEAAADIQDGESGV